MSVLQSLTDEKLLSLATKLHPQFLSENYPLGRETYVSGIEKISIYKTYRKNIDACYKVGIKGTKILHHWKNKRSGEGWDEVKNRDHLLIRTTPEIIVIKRHILTKNALSVVMGMKDYFKAGVLLIHSYKHPDGVDTLKNLCKMNGVNLFFSFEV